MKYKIGDIVKLKKDCNPFSWHLENPEKNFYGKITGYGYSDTYYTMYIFEIYSKKEDWSYTEETILGLATEEEKMELFLEEI